MKISKHLTYEEVVKSNTALRKSIRNTPNTNQLNNIVLWAKNIFEPVREFVNAPLGCNSIFRSIKLNRAIGGSSMSQHCANNGAAGDIDCKVYGHSTNKKIFNFIKNNLDFDQLIWEFGTEEEPDWVHCSYVSEKKNRNQILVSYKNKNNKTKYKYYENK